LVKEILKALEKLIRAMGMNSYCMKKDDMVATNQWWYDIFPVSVKL
jgi:hypothetical protein